MLLIVNQALPHTNAVCSTKYSHLKQSIPPSSSLVPRPAALRTVLALLGRFHLLHQLLLIA